MPLGSVFASAVTVTLPEEITTLFPLTDTSAPAVAITVPVAKVIPDPVTVKSTSILRVTVPVPKVSGFGLGISVTESAVIPGSPILIVS